MPFNIKPIKTAEEATENYLSGTANAGDKWLKGYKEPKRDPKAAAIAGNARYKKSVADALAKDAYLHGVTNQNVEEAILTAETIGKEQYTRGTQARAAKVHRKMTKVLAAQKAIMDIANKMPTATIDERLAKQAFIAKEMNKRKGTFN